MRNPMPMQPIEDPDAVNVVLVVEDEILIRMAIADHLREAGLRVYEATTATEAIDLLAHCGDEIDAVFSDIMMPGDTDGVGLAAWMDENCPAVPLILTSGVSDMNQTVIDMR